MTVTFTVTRTPLHAPLQVRLTAQEIARRRAQRLAGKAEDEPEDSAEAFEFASTSGMLPPKHGKLSVRVPLSVRFTPPAPGKFRATFLFRVAKGFPAKVAQHGQRVVAPVGSAPAQLLRLLRARLAALCSSALPGRGPATGIPAAASGGLERAALLSRGRSPTPPPLRT